MSEPFVVGSLILGADDKIAEYVAQKIGHASFEKYVAFGVVRQGVPIGGVVFHNFRQCDVEVSAAFDSPGWALPGTLRGLFDYPFNQLGCARLTAIVGRKNKRSRRFVEGLGFKLEGVARRAFDGRQDSFIFGMLRDECRWLTGGYNRQENTTSTRAA